ncbi:MAG: mechanosensitive ion channel family protein [Filifactoraceae bacterium]
MSKMLVYYKDAFFSYLGYSSGSYFSEVLIFITSFILFYLVGRCIIFLLIKMIEKFVYKHEFLKESNFTFYLDGLLRKMLILTGLFIAIILVEDNIGFRNIVYSVYRIGIIILTASGMVSAMDTMFISIGRVRKDRSEAVNETVMTFLSKIAKILVVIFSILIVLSELGIDVNGIVAGLGLGGVTFALAAKDTATNMFGGINIIIDKPFVVGDWIQTSTVEGIVEGITFRSTRIRNFFDSVMIVPNSTLSNDSITNWSKMNKRKDSFTFGIDYKTDKSKLENVIKRVREYLIAHENILDDTVIVRLNGFKESSIEVYVVYFINILSIEDIKRVREEASFIVIDVLHDEGVEFALPSHNIYMGKYK